MPVLVPTLVLKVNQVTVVVRPRPPPHAAVGVACDWPEVLAVPGTDPDVEDAVRRCQVTEPFPVRGDRGRGSLGVSVEDLSWDQRHVRLVHRTKLPRAVDTVQTEQLERAHLRRAGRQGLSADDRFVQSTWSSLFPGLSPAVRSSRFAGAARCHAATAGNATGPSLP